MRLWKQALCGGASALGVLAMAAAAAADPVATPAVGATFNANANPVSFDTGVIGKVYIGGAVTGLGLVQSNTNFGDEDARGDVSNAQLFIQKTDGAFQFYVQVGAYSFPAVGATYFRSGFTLDNTFGPAPIAYGKWAPNSSFSVIAGKLPTLIGSESVFTFQNVNIERGLLWNQEPVISKGIQANYAKGPIAVSVSLNDGYYSDRYNWISALLTYTFNPRDSITFDGGGNFDHTNVASFATPTAQANGEIFSAAFTHTQGPFSITPYFQYTHTPSKPEAFIFHDASTVGGAVLMKYAFTPHFSVGARGEYISSTGGNFGEEDFTNLLYGPGSKAWSLTVTPTYQWKILFLRAELSYTKIESGVPGFEFGKNGIDTSQVRGLVETGVLF